MAANETWLYRFGIFAVGNSTGEFKFELTAPTSGLLWYGFGGAQEDTGAVVVMFPAHDEANSAYTMNLDTVERRFGLDGIIANAANAGNVTFRWAQNVSNGTATVVKKNSYLIATQVA